MQESDYPVMQSFILVNQFSLGCSFAAWKVALRFLTRLSFASRVPTLLCCTSYYHAHSARGTLQSKEVWTTFTLIRQQACQLLLWRQLSLLTVCSFVITTPTKSHSHKSIISIFYLQVCKVHKSKFHTKFCSILIIVYILCLLSKVQWPSVPPCTTFGSTLNSGS